MQEMFLTCLVRVARALHTWTHVLLVLHTRTAQSTQFIARCCLSLPVLLRRRLDGQIPLYCCVEGDSTPILKYLFCRGCESDESPQ